MSHSNLLWVLIAGLAGLGLEGCQSDPNPGGQGGAGGRSNAGAHAGGAAGKAVAGGTSVGGTVAEGGDTTIGGAIEVGGAAGEGGLTGSGGAQVAGSSGYGGGGPVGKCPANPANTRCASPPLYCMTDDGQTCACTNQGVWLCFGGPDPLKSTEVVLTGTYHGQNNQACWSCAQTNCLVPQKAFTCEAKANVTSTCLKLLACELESGCALGQNGVTGCYCGSSATYGDCLYASGQNGVCRDGQANGIGLTSAPNVLYHFTDSLYASGPANGLVECLVESGCSSCFRSNQQNACPAVVAVLAAPRDSYVGRSVSLTASATDSDKGPSALGYSWTVDNAGVGVIAGAETANASFSCKAAGKATVTLTVSDGDAGCDWVGTQVINCYQSACPYDTTLGASSRAAFLGDAISLSVDAGYSDGQPGIYGFAWSATPTGRGTLTSDNTSTASYTCNTAGVATVAVTVSGGGCNLPLTINLTCVVRDTAGGTTKNPDTTQSALTGAYRGLDNQACLACAEAHCVDAKGRLPCEYRTDPAERALCLQLLKCELESGCASPADWELTACYCSTNDGCWTDTGAHNGPCAAQIQAGLGSADANYIMNHLHGDTTLPGSPANLVTSCLALNGCASCFPPANVCPTIDQSSATPSSAKVGETIALTAHATDPDSGPDALSYTWAGSDDSRWLPTPGATFTCTAVGTTDLVLVISDGDCTRVANVTVTCTAP